MSLVQSLRAYNERKKAEQIKDSETDTVKRDAELLEEAYCKLNGPAEKTSASYSVIPKFYSQLPKDDQVLRQKLRAAARTTFLRKMNAGLMTHEELQRLWEVLEESSSPPKTGDELMIHFQDFNKARDKVTEKCQKYFTPSTFAKLIRDDPLGRISIMHLFNYIMKTEWLKQTRISLSLFDVQGLGFLRETDLENYILELIPTLTQLSSLEESFYSFYVCTAVRRFFFFLDPLRTGKIKIQDILACGFLDDLLELRDDDLSKEQQSSNWFSAPSALRVYGQYLTLDSDHNGMLSKRELAKFGTGTLTDVFIDRVFQECLTYDGEVDYKTYLDFVLAMENKNEPQSLQYFFRLVDIRGCGYLDGFTLKYFFRAIQDMMLSQDQEPIEFEDVKDEIFDMVKPQFPLIITLQDLITSGQGGTVVSLLTDLHGFWLYENREVLLTENSTDQ